MTTTIEHLHGTTTQFATFTRDEVDLFVETVLGCEAVFADDSIGDRFAVQIDPEELHIQVHAPDTMTNIGELMMVGAHALPETPDETVETLFAAIIERFGEESEVRDRMIDFGSIPVADFRYNTLMTADDIDTIRTARRMRHQKIDTEMDEIKSFKPI